MKICNKLMRKLLIEVRDKNQGDAWIEIDFEGYDKNVINEHVRIASEMGLIEIIDLSTIESQEYRPKRLKSLGYIYIDQYLAPWWKKLILKIFNVTGKFIWMGIGAVMGSASTIIAQHFLIDFIK